MRILANNVIGPTSSTDTAIVIWDGTTGNLVKNQSTFTINGSGNMIGTGDITLGNITWSAAGDYFNSVATLSFSTTGANDMNFTCGLGGNINLISAAGQVNVVSDQDCTFGSASGGFILNAGTNIDLTTGGFIKANSNIVLDNQNEVRFRELTANGTNYAGLKAPASLAADYTLTMPTALPVSTQAIFSTSGGVLSFNTVPTYTSTGTDNRIVRWDGTTGIQDSLVTIDDAGAISGLTQLDCDNLRLNGNTLASTDTNGNIVLDPNGTGVIQLSADTELAGNKLKVGATNEAAISYSTNLIINPAVSGTGFVYIGDGSTPATLQASRLGLGTDGPSNARVISATLSSSTVSTGMVLDLTHTGATAAMRAMNFTARHGGSSGSPSASSLFTSLNTTDTSGTTTMIAIQGQPQAGVACTQGTKTYIGWRTSGSDGGFTHTGGTIRYYGMWAMTSPAFAGGATVTTWGGMFEDDVQITSGFKLILEGSNTSKGDSYLVFTSGTPSIDVYLNGAQSWTWTTSLNKSEVVLSTKAGSSTTYAKVGGIIDVNSTAVGNVGVGEDDLITFSVPASTLNTNGDSIEFEMAGSYAANANNKQVKIKYGATTMFASGALAINNGAWSCKGRIVRTGAATQLYYIQFFTDNALLVASTKQGTAAETLSGAVTLKATGEATSNNDIQQTLNVVRFHPNE